LPAAPSHLSPPPPPSPAQPAGSINQFEKPRLDIFVFRFPGDLLHGCGAPAFSGRLSEVRNPSNTCGTMYVLRPQLPVLTLYVLYGFFRRPSRVASYHCSLSLRELLPVQATLVESNISEANCLKNVRRLATATLQTRTSSQASLRLFSPFDRGRRDTVDRLDGSWYWSVCPRVREKRRDSSDRRVMPLSP
jgi:hypothetical protein